MPRANITTRLQPGCDEDHKLRKDLDGGQGRFNSDGVVCVGRVGLTLGIWFDLDARGRSPHVRFEAPAHC